MFWQAGLSKQCRPEVNQKSTERPPHMFIWKNKNDVMWIQLLISLRKHAYSYILTILQPKKRKFSDKKNTIFFIFLFKT